MNEGLDTPADASLRATKGRSSPLCYPQTCEPDDIEIIPPDEFIAKEGWRRIPVRARMCCSAEEDPNRPPRFVLKDIIPIGILKLEDDIGGLLLEDGSGYIALG